MSTRPLLDTVSLEPSPVVEAYKRDVDMTLIEENLKLTVDERVRKMIASLRLAEELRDSRVVNRCPRCGAATAR